MTEIGNKPMTGLFSYVLKEEGPDGEDDPEDAEGAADVEEQHGHLAGRGRVRRVGAGGDAVGRRNHVVTRARARARAGLGRGLGALVVHRREGGPPPPSLEGVLDLANQPHVEV